MPARYRCVEWSSNPSFPLALALPPTRQHVQTPADASTAFALRVRVYAYAEDTTAAWVMLAVRTQVQAAS